MKMLQETYSEVSVPVNMNDSIAPLAVGTNSSVRLNLNVQVDPRLAEALGAQAAGYGGPLPRASESDSTNWFQQALEALKSWAEAEWEATEGGDSGSSSGEQSAKSDFVTIKDRIGMMYAKVSDIKELLSDIRTSTSSLSSGGMAVSRVEPGGDSNGGSQDRNSGSARTVGRFHDSFLGGADASMAFADFNSSLSTALDDGKSAEERIFGTFSALASVTTGLKGLNDVGVGSLIGKARELGSTGRSGGPGDDDRTSGETVSEPRQVRGTGRMASFGNALREKSKGWSNAALETGNRAVGTFGDGLQSVSSMAGRGAGQVRARAAAVGSRSMKWVDAARSGAGGAAKTFNDGLDTITSNASGAANRLKDRVGRGKSEGAGKTGGRPRPTGMFRRAGAVTAVTGALVAGTLGLGGGTGAADAAAAPLGSAVAQSTSTGVAGKNSSQPGIGVGIAAGVSGLSGAGVGRGRSRGIGGVSSGAVSSSGGGMDKAMGDRLKATKDFSKAATAADKAQQSLDKTVKKSAGSQKSATSATKKATIATKAFNFATRMNPLGLVVTAVELLISNWGKLGKVFNNVKKKMLDPLAKWVVTMWNEKILPIFKVSSGKIGGFFKSMGGIVKGALDGVVDKMRSVVGFVANVLDKISSVASYIPGAPDLSGVVGKLRAFADGGQKKADGGLLRGPGGPRDDLIPVMASNGEYIVNAGATAENLPLLEAINSGQLSWFAGSDRIGEYSSWSDWAGGDVKSAAMRGFFGGKGEAPVLEDIEDPREKARQTALVEGKTAIAGALGTGASGFLGDALGVFGVDRVPPLVQAAMKTHNAMVDQQAAANEKSAGGSEAELVAAAAQSNDSLLASVSRDAAGLAGLEGLQPLRLPAMSGAAGRGNSTVDQSMSISLSTPDIDTAFNKAKTWEAQRALTYTARWN
ncbi:hypothetical protein ACFO5K_12510 [Nocardia halotolerans]|uniref:Uncharacterized protein n=1 Tax=Nocardia halotolerans TaxID=1755878 RepID=A0ABV8VFY1_9NOCA